MSQDLGQLLGPDGAASFQHHRAPRLCLLPSKRLLSSFSLFSPPNSRRFTGEQCRRGRPSSFMLRWWKVKMYHYGSAKRDETKNPSILQKLHFRNCSPAQPQCCKATWGNRQQQSSSIQSWSNYDDGDFPEDGGDWCCSSVAVFNPLCFPLNPTFLKPTSSNRTNKQQILTTCLMVIWS